MNKLAWLSLGVLGLTGAVWAQTNTNEPVSLEEPPFWAADKELADAWLALHSSRN